MHLSLTAVNIQRMHGVGEEFEELRRRRSARLADARAVVDRWRAEVRDKIENIDAQDSAVRAAEDDHPSAEAPPAYHRLQEKVDQGELSWTAALTGETEDADARAVHAWLQPRLSQARQIFAMTAQGVPLEKAIAEVTAARDDRR
ncbi:hypothetical protein [Plantactinospora sp. DSM 117369]